MKIKFRIGVVTSVLFETLLFGYFLRILEAFRFSVFSYVQRNLFSFSMSISDNQKLKSAERGKEYWGTN